jgi:hypothetical protein
MSSSGYATIFMWAQVTIVDVHAYVMLTWLGMEVRRAPTQFNRVYQIK